MKLLLFMILVMEFLIEGRQLEFQLLQWKMVGGAGWKTEDQHLMLTPIKLPQELLRQLNLQSSKYINN